MNKKKFIIQYYETGVKVGENQDSRQDIDKKKYNAASVVVWVSA